MARRDFLRHLGFITAQPLTINKPVMNEQEKINELMKPRYILENEYPGCEFNAGDILVPIPQSNAFSLPENQSVYAILEDDLKKYPYLFRELQWWEERKPEEMPEYVKYAENGMVAKVDHFDLETTSAWFMYLEGGIHPYCPGGSALENTHWLPATAADYQAFITKPVNQESNPLLKPKSRREAGRSMNFDPNTHGAFINLGNGMTAFVDGIPDKCEHEWNGKGYHFVSLLGGGGMDSLIPDTGQTQDELLDLDEQLRKNGKYLSGGCVSCSKCGKPYEPPMFDI